MESQGSKKKKLVPSSIRAIYQKIQARFGSHQKVKALEDPIEQPEHKSETFTRVVVLERESPNPISLAPDPQPSEPSSSPKRSPVDVIRREQIEQLSEFGWYWANLSRTSAQERLNGKPNGSFLVRESQTENTFTVSFRSSGVTLHCRIFMDDDHNWSHIENIRFPSVVKLIEETMRRSETSVFGFVKQNSNLQPPFPVRLLYPINRFHEVPLLKEISRRVILRQLESNAVDISNVDLLPLPARLQEYLREKPLAL